MSSKYNSDDITVTSTQRLPKNQETLGSKRTAVSEGRGLFKHASKLHYGGCGIPSLGLRSNSWPLLLLFDRFPLYNPSPGNPLIFTKVKSPNVAVLFNVLPSDTPFPTNTDDIKLNLINFQFCCFSLELAGSGSSG